MAQIDANAETDTDTGTEAAKQTRTRTQTPPADFVTDGADSRRHRSRRTDTDTEAATILSQMAQIHANADADTGHSTEVASRFGCSLTQTQTQKHSRNALGMADIPWLGWPLPQLSPPGSLSSAPSCPADSGLRWNVGRLEGLLGLAATCENTCCGAGGQCKDAEVATENAEATADSSALCALGVASAPLR